MSDFAFRDPAFKIIEKYTQDAPVNVDGIAQEIGLVVHLEAMEPGYAGRIVRDAKGSPAGYTIYINKTDSPSRRRFTLAHEIGHYILHRDMIGDGLIDTALYRSRLGDLYERQANRFAADTLMPAGVTRCLYRGGMVSLAPLAESLGVSVDAVRIRLQELNLG